MSKLSTSHAPRLPIFDQDLVIIPQKSADRKLTIIVSKKIAKKATDRNRIKRIIKETLRHLALKNTGFKIIVKNNLANLKTADIEHKLAKLFAKT